MIRNTSVFVCQQCSYETGKWLGKCPECGSWNSMVETVTKKSNSGKTSNSGKIGGNTKTFRLSDITSSATKRISTQISELDRVLGGGIVSGQVALIAGEPGIGKSTLLLQLADSLSTSHSSPSTVLYVSGEESVNQIKIRADRLGVKSKNITLAETTDVDGILETVNNGRSMVGSERAHNSQLTTHNLFVIVDSIQTMQTSDLSGMAGSVGQVRECAYRLVRMAKETGIPVFIVGHVTKQGSVAGPSVLMHIVDTVLWFEGDKTTNLRILRSVKNRFGATDEVGIFSMEDKGLMGIDTTEKLFLTQSAKAIAGCCRALIMEGTRPIMVEIQSLVVANKSGFTKHIAQGIDPKKLELLIAVLQRRCNLKLWENDIFVNVAGGINLKNDPSVDLAVCLSIASAYFDKSLPKNFAGVGEVGLLGDVRSVKMQEKREKEAKRLGFEILGGKDNLFLNQIIRELLK